MRRLSSSASIGWSRPASREDWGTPVLHDYKCPLKFTGTLKNVTIEVK